MALVKPFVLIFWSFVAMFIFCNFGENMTNSFKNLNDSFCGCGWYSFPIDVQKMLPTICVAIQQPVVLMCYGNVLYTRETFKKVTFNHRNFNLCFDSDESLAFFFVPFIQDFFLYFCFFFSKIHSNYFLSFRS